jgi:hypothetical protein
MCIYNYVYINIFVYDRMTTIKILKKNYENKIIKIIIMINNDNNVSTHNYLYRNEMARRTHTGC